MQETSREHSKNVHVFLSSGVRAQSLPLMKTGWFESSTSLFRIMFVSFPSCEWQDLLSTFKNCENTTCLDDFDKSKPEIRPASYVTMVVSSIYCDKIVHIKMHLLSTTCQTCINAYSNASLKSNKALINRVEGTETVKFKMLKGTIFVGYQNRKFLICAELPNCSNLRFSQNCYRCKLMTLI